MDQSKLWYFKPTKINHDIKIPKTNDDEKNIFLLHGLSNMEKKITGGDSKEQSFYLKSLISFIAITDLSDKNILNYIHELTKNVHQKALFDGIEPDETRH